MKKKIIYFIIIVLSISCSKEIKLKQISVESRLVLNGFICPDSLVSVNVRKTTGILSDENPIIENATVSLYKNNRFIENLPHIGNGNYKSNKIYPQVDSIYTVEVKAEGLPTVKATDTIPQKTPILSCTKTFGETYDEYGDTYSDYEIEIKDAENKNYYELFFAWQYSPNEVFSSYFINFQDGLEIADPVLKSDSELDTYPFTYIFSDNYFNGQVYNMKNKFRAAFVQVEVKSGLLPTDFDNYAVLKTTSSVYFNYRKYWLRHSYNQQQSDGLEDPLFSFYVGTPIEMYSNVENGYGIFAAYNQTFFKITIIDKTNLKK